MHLPIANYRERILETILANPVTLIVAETGSGKSTQVPRYLVEAGYRVMVTQPRRLAALSVAEFVAHEFGEPIGQTVGIRTRDQKCTSPETRLVFATDGLVVMRELTGYTGYDVLIIDEVHEWNLHIEALIALARQATVQDRPLKIVIMSATIDAEGLSEYFDHAPVITVSGRAHQVKKLQKGKSIAEDAAYWLMRRKNVLIFLPGKREIEDMMKALVEEHGVDAEVLPLHAELRSSEQQKCFGHYPRPKCIVATSVAQTSITIDDIDLVIDSGLENRAELHGGIPGLYERVISIACAEQRRGRAGRTKPGYYIDHAPETDRDEYPVPEILRIKLDQLALRLAMVDRRMDGIEFFHQPPRDSVLLAERMLQELQCLRSDFTVTKKGRRIALLPISVEAGCMFAEAERLGMLDVALPIIAVYESGGITDDHGWVGTGEWRELCLDEEDSDLLAQAKVFLALRSMAGHKRSRYAIKPKAFEKAQGVLVHLERLGYQAATVLTGEHEALLGIIYEGLKSHIFVREGSSTKRYLAADGAQRKLQRYSVIKPHKRIIGAPWDISPELGGPVINLVTFATRAI